MAQSNADKAYQWAENEIARVKAEGGLLLDLGQPETRALKTLPPQIAELEELRNLYLSDTQVSDISAISGIVGMQSLNLSGTQVSDISAISGMVGMQSLHLSRTQVSDISAISGMVGMQDLYLSDTQVSDISAISGMVGMQRLNLNGTQVSNISAISGMVGMQSLNLRGTQVSDISAISGMGGMQDLDLSRTQVSDLRPICKIDSLVQDKKPIFYWGLRYKNTPAVAADTELARLAEVEEDKTRTLDTLAYLNTLPEWPLPLDGGGFDKPTKATLPRLILTNSQKIDLDHSATTKEDKADPIKEKLYNKLPKAVEALLRFGNQYIEVDGPARELEKLLTVDFIDADLLDIHLQFASLTDLRENNVAKLKAEQLDVDCLRAVNEVLRLGPPVTMGHPDVELFEKRNIEYARNRHEASVIAGEIRIIEGVAEDDKIATDRLRKNSAAMVHVDNKGRSAAYRSDTSRNLILILAYLTEQTVSAAVGIPFGTAVVNAANFLLAHHDAIMATAPSWGETGFLWASQMLERAKKIVEDAKGD